MDTVATIHEKSRLAQLLGELGVSLSEQILFGLTVMQLLEIEDMARRAMRLADEMPVDG